MSHQLSFEKLFHYDMKEGGITVGVTLRFSGKEEIFDAKIDTGASFCVFEREHGENLGIEIESGLKRAFGTATGMFTAYGHSVVLEALGLEFETVVFFAVDNRIGRNVLGQQGWLNKVRVGIVDYDGELYLDYYDNK